MQKIIYLKVSVSQFSILQRIILSLYEMQVQGFHWNSSQGTIHSFVIYYVNSEKRSQDRLDHLSIACISDHLKHDTVAVYSFQKVVLRVFESKTSNVEKMIYFSDGCGGQYKIYKNFMNLIKPLHLMKD